MTDTIRIAHPTTGADSFVLHDSGQATVQTTVLGGLKIDMGIDSASTPIEGGIWYESDSLGDGIETLIPVGSLADYVCLTMDLLLDGTSSVNFLISLKEGENGRHFRFSFGLLNQCSARLRMPLSAVDQNVWMLEREGALLKPYCMGDRVDLSKVDRVIFTVQRNGDRPVRWCMTPLMATSDMPPLLTDLVLPKGALLDQLGQSTLHEWPTKQRSEAQMIDAMRSQLTALADAQFPDSMNRWGGSTTITFDATGFFRCHHDGKRWYLVDPDGGAFWSSGFNCFTPNVESTFTNLEPALMWIPPREGEFSVAYRYTQTRDVVSYLTTNFVRAYGQDWFDKWVKVALGFMRQTGFNTVGNWSTWRSAQQAGFPFVVPFEFEPQYLDIKTIFRDFPDVFAPEFDRAAVQFARQLIDTRDDRAMVGYFLMNEPMWGFSEITPAAGMLFNTPECHTRRVFADRLRRQYGDEAAFQQAWGEAATFAQVESGTWTLPITERAQADLNAFSTVMVDRLFGMLSAECRKVDPNHLNLGIRYYTNPPDWALDGMRHFDVFSANCYQDRIKAEYAGIAERLNVPILIGEYHFGALDVGLSSSGIGHVPDQESRGKAFRIYVEDAASKPWCVGAHYFTLYDQSALGRYDGENYQIGFMDTCGQPYQPMADAARATHSRLYEVASGSVPKYDDPPVYLSKLFF